MSGNGHLSPAQVHAKVKHPIIDGDGHWVEFPPVFAEKMRKVGGDKAADGFLAPRGAGEGLKMTPAERTERRIAQPNFWNRQGENTLDRATAMMPRLLYERLDEIGSDFVVIYPTAGLGLPRIKDDATRRAVIRAYNIVSADYFRDFSDRMTPAAVIPMHTPEEAIEELEFVTKELGSKVGMFGSNLPRPARPPWRRMTNLERMDPAKLDRKLLMELVVKYGYDDMAEALRARDGYPNPEAHLTGGRAELDDFAACKITRKEDWLDLYARPYYFGCEADDRMNVCAFSRANPFGAQLNAIYSSDIGHFDVIDMRDPLPEAWKLVEDGLITEDNFRAFTFANAVRLWGAQNPRFFEGTVVANEAAAVLTEPMLRAAAE